MKASSPSGSAPDAAAGAMMGGFGAVSALWADATGEVMEEGRGRRRRGRSTKRGLRRVRHEVGTPVMEVSGGGRLPRYARDLVADLCLDLRCPEQGAGSDLMGRRMPRAMCAHGVFVSESPVPRPATFRPKCVYPAPGLEWPVDRQWASRARRGTPGMRAKRAAHWPKCRVPVPGSQTHMVSGSGRAKVAPECPSCPPVCRPTRSSWQLTCGR
jgi:hypothetical protein